MKINIEIRIGWISKIIARLKGGYIVCPLRGKCAYRIHRADCYNVRYSKGGVYRGMRFKTLEKAEEYCDEVGWLYCQACEGKGRL